MWTPSTSIHHHSCLRFLFPPFWKASGAALFLVPFLLIAVWLNQRRKKFKAEALEPFTELPLRPPGESLRLKIDELSTDFDTLVTSAAMIGLGAAVFVTSMSSTLRPTLGLGIFVFTLGAYAYSAIRLAKLQKKLWMYRLGFTGERIVGEELNQLLASGFKVFHDVPFENFNIDHVLVGPPGVYALDLLRREETFRRGREGAFNFVGAEHVNVASFRAFNAPAGKSEDCVRGHRFARCLREPLGDRLGVAPRLLDETSVGFRGELQRGSVRVNRCAF